MDLVAALNSLTPNFSLSTSIIQVKFKFVFFLCTLLPNVDALIEPIEHVFFLNI